MPFIGDFLLTKVGRFFLATPSRKAGFGNVWLQRDSFRTAPENEVAVMAEIDHFLSTLLQLFSLSLVFLVLLFLVLGSLKPLNTKGLRA